MFEDIVHCLERGEAASRRRVILEKRAAEAHLKMLGCLFQADAFIGHSAGSKSLACGQKTGLLSEIATKQPTGSRAVVGERIGDNALGEAHFQLMSKIGHLVCNWG